MIIHCECHNLRKKQVHPYTPTVLLAALACVGLVSNRYFVENIHVGSKTFWEPPQLRRLAPQLQWSRSPAPQLQWLGSNAKPTPSVARLLCRRRHVPTRSFSRFCRRPSASRQGRRFRGRVWKLKLESSQQPAARPAKFPLPSPSAGERTLMREGRSNREGLLVEPGGPVKPQGT